MTTSKEAAIEVFECINECIGPGNYSWRDDRDTFDDIISELANIIDQVDHRGQPSIHNDLAVGYIAGQRDSAAHKHLRSVIETCDAVGRAYADGKSAETIGAAERAIMEAREFLDANGDTVNDEECGLCERCSSNVPEQKLTEWVGQGINICDDCRTWMLPDSPGMALNTVRENLAKLGWTEEEIDKLETEEVES